MGWHQYDAKLDDVSKAAHAANVKRLEAVLAKVGVPSIPMIESHLNDPVLKFRLTMVDDLRQIGAPSTVARSTMLRT